MKTLQTLAAFALVPSLFLTACSGEDVQAAMEKVETLDLTSLSPEQMTSKFKDIGGQLTEKLGGIKDLASAKDIVPQIQPLLENATKLKQALGDKLPSLESLGTVVKDLKSKFADNDAIMNVLRPVLEKLQGLAG